MQTVQASLGCWNAIRLRALILGPLGISAGAMLVLIEWRDPEWLPWALGVVGLVSVVFAYWMLLGVVNRWTVTADRRGVVAQFGPLPWVWGTRAFPAADIRGFLSAENIVDMGDHEARIVALRSSYGIDVLHPDGTVSALVQGCGHAPEVAKVRQALVALFGTH